MYKGLIKKSRTYDSIAFSQIVDAAALTWMAYTPDQLGVTIPVYAGIRFIIHVVQGILRAKTTGPVGQK